MPVNKPLIPPPPLPPGTDLPGLLRSIADTELVSSAGLAVAVRTAADEIDRLRAALVAQPQPDEPRCGDCGGPIDTNGLCLNLDIARPTGGVGDTHRRRGAWIDDDPMAAAGSATPTGDDDE